MNDLRCEDVLMAKMAEFDGEKIPVAPAIELHLKACAGCSREIAEMQQLDRIFMQQVRPKIDIEIWPAVERTTSPSSVGHISWIPFAVVGALLVVYKFAELIPERGFGISFTIVPLVLLIVLFLVLRENPFRVNSELTLER